MFAESPLPFTITVSDPCDDATILNPTAQTDQEYTLSDVAFDYVILPFTATPAFCEISYSSIATSVAQLAFGFAIDTFTFYNGGTDPLLVLADYEITVQANVGALTVEEKFTLKIKDPCSDPGLVSVVPPAASSDPVEYSYAKGGVQFGVAGFTANPVICPLTYACSSASGGIECGDIFVDS